MSTAPPCWAHLLTPLFRLRVLVCSGCGLVVGRWCLTAPPCDSTTVPAAIVPGRAIAADLRAGLQSGPSVRQCGESSAVVGPWHPSPSGISGAPVPAPQAPLHALIAIGRHGIAARLPRACGRWVCVPWGEGCVKSPQELGGPWGFLPQQRGRSSHQ